jgi:hypothetical protein
MIDIPIIWQKIKLVFSFLKLPSWIYKKLLFWHRYRTFNKLAKDKRKFMFEVYRNKQRGDVMFYNNNKVLIKCLEIDGFINSVYYERDWEEQKEECYTYTLTPEYLPIVEKAWRKSKDKHFQETTFDYSTEDIPF